MIEKNTILISHYNSLAFIKLLDLFKDFNINVYNKSGRGLVKSNIQQTILQNEGRETHTYLKYIIDNYEDISPVSVLIQDDTNNHIHNYKHFRKYVDSFIEESKYFEVYPAQWREDCDLTIKRTIHNGVLPSADDPPGERLPHVPSTHAKTIVNLIAKKFNLHVPKIYDTYCCAFLICSKKSIHSHPKQFYIDLLNFYMTNEICSTHIKGYVFEHIWKLIFMNSESDNK